MTGCRKVGVALRRIPGTPDRQFFETAECTGGLREPKLKRRCFVARLLVGR